MDLDVTVQDDLDSDGNKQYELCLFFNSTLPECTKQGKISHACPSDKEDEKIEGWKQGRDEAMCTIVSCGQFTHFGVKDGKTCDGGSAYGDFGITGYNEWVTCFDGGYCGGGNTKACRWQISAPDCDPREPATTAFTANTDDIAGCVCTDIDIWSYLQIEDGIAACSECGNCYVYQSEECLPLQPTNPTGDNVYVRNSKTLMNSNLNFVVDDSINSTDATNDVGELIAISRVGLIIFVCCMFIF
jgi:hypothetical protein